MGGYGGKSSTAWMMSGGSARAVLSVFAWWQRCCCCCCYGQDSAHDSIHDIIYSLHGRTPTDRLPFTGRRGQNHRRPRSQVTLGATSHSLPFPSFPFFPSFPRRPAFSSFENLYSPKNDRSNNELTNSTNKQQ